MKIKLLKRMAGPEGNFGAGTVITVAEEIGNALIEAGAGIVVPEETVSERADSPVETATAPEYEVAVAPRQKRQKRGKQA